MSTFKAIAQKAPIRVRVVQTAAAGTFPDCFIFANPAGSGEYFEVVGANCAYDVVGSTNAAADVVICTATTQPSSGVSVLASAFDLTATARTAYKKALHPTNSHIIPPGSCLVINTSGTLTNLVGAVIEVILNPIIVKRQA